MVRAFEPSVDESGELRTVNYGEKIEPRSTGSSGCRNSYGVQSETMRGVALSRTVRRYCVFRRAYALGFFCGSPRGLAPLAGRAAARLRNHGAIQRRHRGARCASRGPAARSPRAPRTRSFDVRASFSRPSRLAWRDFNTRPLRRPRSAASRARSAVPRRRRRASRTRRLFSGPAPRARKRIGPPVSGPLGTADSPSGHLPFFIRPRPPTREQVSSTARRARRTSSPPRR